MSLLIDVTRYLKVGRLLHLIAFMDLVISVLCITILVNTSIDTEPGLFILTAIVLWLFGGMTFFAEFDGWSRYQNYKQVKDQLFLYGYQERLLKPMLKSRCQRDAAQVACSELGVGDQCKAHFKQHGYRWHHVFPDFVFQQPMFFFTSFFWRTTFFTPYYKPKFDYNQVDLDAFILRHQELKLEAAY